MQTIMDECENLELKKLFLEVRESNEVAINLYIKFGFKKISKRTKYYDDGETAVIMLKEFDYKK